MNIENKNISENIRVMAAASGVSLSEVARRVGETPQQLAQRLKKGKLQADLDYLDKIADACGYCFKWDFVRNTETGGEIPPEVVHNSIEWLRARGLSDSDILDFIKKWSAPGA